MRQTMQITVWMAQAMIELKAKLADALDDDCADIADEVLRQYGMTHEENEYCIENYLSVAWTAVGC